MKNESLLIKFFAPREVDEKRVEPGGGGDAPKWLLTGEQLQIRSEKLLSSFSELDKIITARQEKNSVVPFVFVAKMCDDATAKSRRKDIVSFFQYSEKRNVIGLSDSDELLVKIGSKDEISNIYSRLQNFQQNNYAISCLEDFEEFQPSIRINEDEKTYKIKLINFQDYETDIAMQRIFERELNAKKIKYKKTLYAEQLPIYKISNMSKTMLDDLKNNQIYEMLFSIEPMPKYQVALDTFLEEEQIDVIKPIDGKKYETLGILDNGISTIPHLSPWMADKRWSVYPESLIKQTHGTFVAGVALYGDILEGQNWINHNGIKLFDAAIFPDEEKESLDEDELIANIRDAISTNYEKVKIWNLSISITRPINDTKFSDLAIALDALQDEYNVLICKSAGNCNNFLNGLPKGRIHEGADSVRSLVVGSVAHVKGIFDIAEVDNPSPFSRIGPGPEFIIKPEVSHYGGNAGIDNNGKLSTTGVKSFSANGRVAKGVGTSFSTPRIAALATGLYQELDEPFDPLLLKGLIIHSASYSDDLIIPQTERTKQLGFGIPKSVPEIIYNSPYEATLILRDTIIKGEYIDIMDFPMPKSLIRDGFYTGQVIVTLVYEPILDATQGIEYCQSNVDVKFGSYDEKMERDMNKRNILNPIGRKGAKNLLNSGLYSKRLMKDAKSDFALKERLLIQYADKYYPVKKYAVDLSELSDANKLYYASDGKRWYLYLRGLYREYIEQKAILDQTIPSQEVCIIITIRDPQKEANVYNEVTQQLDALNFWHSNVKVSNNITVSV